MTKTLGEAIAAAYERDDVDAAARRRAADAAAFDPDPQLEQLLARAERDPAVKAELERIYGPTADFGARGFHARYVAARGAAIEAGSFDPATYQEERS